MFYLKEIFFRVFYAFIAFFLLFCVVFYFEEAILCGFIFSIIDHSSLNIPSFPEYSFIFEGLEKFIIFKVGFSFTCSLCLLAPFYIKQLYEFYLTCISQFVDNKLREYLNIISFIFIFFNIILFFKILPFFWILVDSTAAYISESSLVNIELNSGIELFFNFLFHSVFIFNINFIISFSLLIYCFFNITNKNYKNIYLLVFIKNITIYTLYLVIFLWNKFDVHIIIIYFINILLYHLFDFILLILVIYNRVICRI